MSEFPTIWRATQVAAVADRWERPGAAAVYLTGPLGIGKSTLLAQLRQHAHRIGRPAPSVAATRATAGSPFAAIADLLSGGDWPANRRVVARLADAALRRIAPAGRVVVLVDDAPLLDEESAALLHKLAVAGRVFLVATTRVGERLADPLVALWREDLAVELTVPPLTLGEVDEVLAGRLGGQVDLGAVHELFRLSEGNPLYLREVIRAALESAWLCGTTGLWRLCGTPGATASLAKLLNGWLGDVGAAARSATEFVAFAEPLGLDLLRPMVPATGLEQAEAAGLLRLIVTGQRRQLELTHPLAGVVLRASTPPLRAAGINARLAEVVRATGMRRYGDALRAGRWQVAAGQVGQPRLLLAAAAEAARASDADGTLRLAGAARVAGAGRAAMRWEATALTWLGRTAEAEALLAQCARQSTGDVELIHAALLRAGNLWLGHGRARAVERVLRDAEAGVRVPRLRALLLAVRALVLVQSGRASDGVAVSTEALAQATNPAEIAHLLAVQGIALAEVGRAGQALAAVETAVRDYGGQVRRYPYLGDGFGLARVTALEQAGRLIEAAELATARYRAALNGAGDHVRAAWAGAAGRIALRRGRVATAERYLRECISLHRNAVTLQGPAGLVDAHAALARACVLRGQHVEAGTALEQAAAIRRETDADPAEVDIAHAWLLVAGHAYRQGHDLLSRTAERTIASGQLRTAQRALHDLARLGAPDRALAGLSELAGRADGELSELYAGHAAAMANRDPAALREFSVRLLEIGATLEAAEAAAHAADAFRRRGDARHAAVAIERAHLLLARCEGAGFAGPCRPLPASTLTGRQREIAALAASGLSNRDIAQSLTLSVRTVENHLHATYSKLDIPGRAALLGMTLPRFR